MSSCAVKWCGKNSRNSRFSTDGITFHRFPKDPALKEKWVDVTKRENWFPSKYSVVCSRHFTDESFVISMKNRRLLDSAVPTLFLPVLAAEKDPLEPEKPAPATFIILTSNTNHIVPDNSKPAQVSPPTNMPLCVPIAPKITQIKVEKIPQPMPAQFYSPVMTESCKCDKTLSKQISRKNIQIKNLREKVRYLQNRVATLKATIKEFEAKSIIKIEPADA